QMNITSEAFSSFENFKNFDITNTDSSRSINFILTDIQMPKIDGFTVLKNLKNGEVNSYKNQPIIAMTGSREHNRDFYFGKGFAEMLPKPFTKQELVAVLERIFPERIHPGNVKNTEVAMKKTTSKNDKFELSLLKSFLNTPEALDEVLTIFNAQTETDLREINAAILAGNVEFIKEIAHRMLTMIRQIKAKEVIPLLEKLELYEVENIEILEMKMDYEKLVMNIRDLQKALENK